MATLKNTTINDTGFLKSLRAQLVKDQAVLKQVTLDITQTKKHSKCITDQNG